MTHGWLQSAVVVMSEGKWCCDKADYTEIVEVSESYGVTHPFGFSTKEQYGSCNRLTNLPILLLCQQVAQHAIHEIS